MSSPVGKKRFFSKPNLTVCLILIVLIILLYQQVISFSFINFDDNSYVIDNPNVLQGLTFENVIWAFSTESGKKNYWHPLVWLSYMLDAEFFGAASGYFHISNILLHTASAVLLFAIFNKMTSSFYRSAIIALLFAVHPINVESVAWVAERKNVLSTFFLMLTLLFYAYYASRKRYSYYIAALSSFLMGLLSKPMLVSLPFLLLLLDYWPLNRVNFSGKELAGHGAINHRWLYLLFEKVPFFLFGLCSIYLSSLTLNQSDRFISFAVRPLSLRIANALNSYVIYIGKLFWPTNLAVYYPYPSSISLAHLIGAILLLTCFSILTIFLVRKYPYLIVGWFWYLIALFPVSGLVQAGLWPALADRYAYVPFIGLFAIISWGGNDLLKRYFSEGKRTFLFLILLIVLMPITWLQVRTWQDDTTLFKHAVEVTAKNSLAHTNLGGAYYKSGRIFDAIDHFSEAVRITPNYDKAHSNLGSLYYLVGRPEDAINHLQKALLVNPAMSIAEENLNKILQELNSMNDAYAHYNKILVNNPEDAVAHFNAGLALFRMGKISESIIHFKEALRLKPELESAEKALVLAKASILHTKNNN